MSHVRKGCLSDPPKDVIRLHRINPVTGKGFSGRSTGTNENDNMFLNRLLNTPSIGLARAERIISDHYEASNAKKEVSRLGGQQHLTNRTEKLYAVNSMHTSCGFPDHDLPVREKISLPRTLDEVEEFLGMTYSLPEAFTSKTEEQDDNGDASTNDLANFLAGIDFDNDDIAIDPTQFGTANNIDDEDVMPIHLPLINPNETTFEAFKRLTQQHPWVPFAKPDKARNELEDEEYSYFNQEACKYGRHVAYLQSKRGYGTFAHNWDIEVATRFKAKASGDDSVILIHRKTALQLQEHYDRLEKHLQQGNLLRPNDPYWDRMQDILKSTRTQRTERQAAQQTRPIQYPQTGMVPFGNPMPLNTNIAAAAFRYNTPTNLVSPFVLRAMPNTQSRIFVSHNFNRNKYCWRCGFQKKLHNDYKVPFGHQCVNNCLREDCSKCGQRKGFHQGGLDGMGPACMRQPHPTSQYFDWHKNNSNTEANI
jgi:hypothetical protein